MAKKTISEVKKILGNGIATVVFTKADGTLRTMRCTTRGSNIPREEALAHARAKVSAAAKKDRSLFKVWDIENNDWRSFRFKTVKSVQQG